MSTLPSLVKDDYRGPLTPPTFKFVLPAAPTWLAKPCTAVPVDEAVPLKWADFVWPDWVPVEVRQEIESFWAEEHGRSPREWEHACRGAYNWHPPLGTEVTCESDARYNHTGDSLPVLGRWVPCWNNMGRVVDKQGKARIRTVGSIARPPLASASNPPWPMPVAMPTVQENLRLNLEIARTKEEQAREALNAMRRRVSVLSRERAALARALAVAEKQSA